MKENGVVQYYTYGKVPRALFMDLRELCFRLPELRFQWDEAQQQKLLQKTCICLAPLGWQLHLEFVVTMVRDCLPNGAN